MDNLWKAFEEAIKKPAPKSAPDNGGKFYVARNENAQVLCSYSNDAAECMHIMAAALHRFDEVIPVAINFDVDWDKGEATYFLTLVLSGDSQVKEKNG